MNVFTFYGKNGIVENSLRILDLCRSPETDPTNPRGSIEPRLRIIELEGFNSVVESPLIVWMGCFSFFLFFKMEERDVNPLSYFSFQLVLYDVCNEGRGMCYPVCGMVHIKEPLLLIGKSSKCGGSGFHLSLSECYFTICLMPYNLK